MISNRLRALCAFAAIALFVGGIAMLVVTPRATGLVPLFGAALLGVPATFSGRKPAPRELARIDEQLRRFRNAMFFCFAAAAFTYGFVLSERRRAAETLLQQLASLGVAFWVVAIVLMFFVAYYRGQRRRIEG
ncbi:MAG TPA: hypothetical protein VNA69_07265 [Thermoanaerobaculia bacterium]|nr:hypothetical protein [Thermoanaerobaculia bacterium]